VTGKQLVVYFRPFNFFPFLRLDLNPEIVRLFRTKNSGFFALNFAFQFVCAWFAFPPNRKLPLPFFSNRILPSGTGMNAGNLMLELVDEFLSMHFIVRFR
jgi:hypothetical protein